MSLREYFMERAALEHQNMLNSDTTGLVLQSLADVVAKGIEAQRAEVQKQRDEERKMKQSIELINSFSGVDSNGLSSGKLIPSIKIEDGEVGVSAHSPTIAEIKAMMEMQESQGL